MKISLLIHGPFAGNILDVISVAARLSPHNIDEYVFVVYISDKRQYEELIYNYFPKQATRIVYIKDLLNPGFANINRQIVSVNAGLSVIDEEALVIKLRNDQCIDFKKLFNEIKDANLLYNQQKILTTNCFSRKDRLYHPSDMFLCAPCSLLRDYYNVPLSKSTQTETIMSIRELMETQEVTYNPFSPESYLFRNYLISKGWDIKETYLDSYNAIKKYIFLVNSWNINLIWNKNRNYPFNKCKQIVLPHYFICKPFENGPVERVRCFAQHDFNKHITLKDCYYLIKSKYIWKFWPDNIEGYSSYKKKYKQKAITHIKHFINPINFAMHKPSAILKWIIDPIKVLYYFFKYLFYKFIKVLINCLN